LLTDEIQRALARHSASLSRLASEKNIDRTFLAKLKNGGHPPRTHRGAPATRDPRYRQIAEALEIADPDRFVRIAAREQTSPPATTSKEAETFRGVMMGQLGDLFGPVADDLEPVVSAYIDSGLVPYGVRRLAWRIRNLPAADAVLQPNHRAETGTNIPERFGGPRGVTSTSPRVATMNTLAHRVADLCLTVEGAVSDLYRSRISCLFEDLSTRDIGTWKAAAALARNLGPPQR
jgi:hypothetical protein